MNGYTRITVKGSEVGLKFAHLANKLFLEAMALNGQYYADANGFNEIGWAKLFHCAYVNNCVIKEAKQVLTLEDFVEWVEGIVGNEERSKEFAAAADTWSEAQATKELIDKVNALSTAPDEKPKKSKKKRLTPDWIEVESALLANGAPDLNHIYGMTPYEVHLKFYGIIKERIETKKNFRDIVWGIHVHNVELKNRVSIYDLLPLPGDPSQKEREKARLQEEKKKARWMLKEARKMGYIS